MNMILKSSHLKTTRFNVDEKFLGKVCDVNERVKFLPELRIQEGSSPHMLIHRWNLDFLSLSTQEEIVRYSGEIESEIRPKNKMQDRDTLIHHIKSSFLNVQMYLHENIPGNFLTANPVKKDFESYADRTLNCIELAGLYRQWQ